MRNSTFDESHLRIQSEADYDSSWYPQKTEVEALFKKHGYNNFKVAFYCSLASKIEFDKNYQRFLSLYNTFIEVSKLKCPGLYKAGDPHYIDEHTRLTLLASLRTYVERELGKHASVYYTSFSLYVCNRAVMLGWDKMMMLYLVEKEMKKGNVNNPLYLNYEAIVLDDLYAAAERAVKYVASHYPKQFPETDAKIIMSRKAYYGIIKASESYLYDGCYGLFDTDDFVPSQINSFVIPKLDATFKKSSWFDPVKNMMEQYGVLFDVKNDEKARSYYNDLKTYYRTLSFPGCGTPSVYVAAQYLYAVICQQPYCTTLPNKVGSLIYELMVLFGYISAKDISSNTDKENSDLIKRYLKLDKDSGMYSRIA